MVDGEEEGHLALTERIQDLPVVRRHPEDALPVGDQLDAGQVLLEARLLPKVLVGPAHPLQGHPAVEEGADDLQGDQIAEGVEPPHTRTSPRGLDARLDQTDLVPVPELMRGTAREATSLQDSETLHLTPFRKNARAHPGKRGSANRTILIF